MHYKNGREAKDGDSIIVLTPGQPVQAGVLYASHAGSDTCNGRLAHTSPGDMYVNIKDCLHVEDVRQATVPALTPNS